MPYEIYWDDLTEEKKQELLEEGYNGSEYENYPICGIATIDYEEEDEQC